MQREIDHLKRSLRHEQRKRVPSNPEFFSGGEEDDSYRRRLRTLLNESFSYDRDYYHEHRDRKPPSVSLGNNAVSKALNQISRSPFTRWIKEGDFLSSFLNPYSPCTTEGRTLWSMLATSIKGWPYTPRTSL